MTTATRADHIEPRNQSHYVAVIAGGAADIYRFTRKKLRREGIDAPIHWEPDNARLTTIPGHVDVVIYLKDFTSPQLEARVFGAAKRAGVPVICTVRKWATMRQHLEHFNVLGVCEALPEDAVDRAVPEPPPSDPGAEEDRAVAAARTRALAAEERIAAERRRADDERRAADERAARYAVLQKAESEEQARRAAEADAEMAALAMATADEDDDQNPQPTHEDTMPTAIAPHQNGATMKTNGHTPSSSDAAAPPLGPELLELVAKHLRALGDVELARAAEQAPDVVARLLRGLDDAALVAATQERADAMLRGTFGDAPAPALAAPAESATATPRARVLEALRELTRGGGAARPRDIAARSGVADARLILRALRDEGVAFQAGWGQGSVWALTQKAAAAALRD